MRSALSCAACVREQSALEAEVSSSPFVRVSEHADHVQLELQGERGNALRPEGLRELTAAFAALGGDRAPAVVLAASGRSFCTGLDLDLAWDLDRNAMRAFMTCFHEALRACALHPAPVVAAIEGHALAGGALLALACERRVVARGAVRFGVHGVQLGVSYPQVAVEIARARLGRRGAEHLLYAGRIHDAPDAQSAGWVDEVVEPGEVRDAARAWLGTLQGGRSTGAIVLRGSVRRPLAAALESLDRAGMEAWLDQWFAPSTRAALHAARAEREARRGARPARESSPTTRRSA